MGRLPFELSVEPTLGGLIRTLFSGAMSAVRENRLAATLAALAGVLMTVFAFSIQYDERPLYRQSILPGIERAEANFTITMENAEHAPSEAWRLQYFLTAHSKARDALRVARDRLPNTDEALAAHQQLIRYYELVNEELAIIRTQMSVDEKMDYWTEWKTQRDLLEPIRRQWLTWVGDF